MNIYPFKHLFNTWLFIQSLELVENVQVISLIKKQRPKELYLPKIIKPISHSAGCKLGLSPKKSKLKSVFDIFPLSPFWVMAKFCMKYIDFEVQNIYSFLTC